MERKGPLCRDAASGSEHPRFWLEGCGVLTGLPTPKASPLPCTVWYQTMSMTLGYNAG